MTLCSPVVLYVCLTVFRLSFPNLLCFGLFWEEDSPGPAVSTDKSTFPQILPTSAPFPFFYPLATAVLAAHERGPVLPVKAAGPLHITGRPKNNLSSVERWHKNV